MALPKSYLTFKVTKNIFDGNTFDSFQKSSADVNIIYLIMMFVKA